MSDHSESTNRPNPEANAGANPGANPGRTLECTDVLAALPLYVGQDMDSAELEGVALHLNGCDPCTAEHDRAQSARAVLVAGAWVGPESEGPSLWEGVRAGMVAEGLIAGGPRLVSGPAGLAGTRPRATTRVPGSRWWIGSGAAAAALFFAFGLSGLLGPLGSSGGGFTGSAVDVDGTRPTVSMEGSGSMDGSSSMEGSSETRNPGHLRRPGADRAPLLQNAVEWLPDQGIYVPVTAPPEPSLIEGPQKLRPLDK